MQHPGCLSQRYPHAGPEHPEALASGDAEASSAALAAASRKLDKAAGKGVIHANQAANKKSSMAKKVAAL